MILADDRRGSNIDVVCDVHRLQEAATKRSVITVSVRRRDERECLRFL